MSSDVITKDLSKLDLAFILDCTSSMSSYINSAKENIVKIADEITKNESCHLRVSLVSYRDHPPQDHTYIANVDDFTDDIKIAKQFISKATAYGGGDAPEAVCCGLYKALESLNWQNDSVKVAILIADAPPHGLDQYGDGFPNGCPDKNDPVEIAHKMAEKGITLYCAGCEPALQPYRQFFIALTLITGGQYVPLNNAENLAKVIVGGTREDISMEKLMAQVHNEVMKEAAESGKRIDEDELTKRVHNLLNSRGSTINPLSTTEHIKIEDKTKELSKEKTLRDFIEFSKVNSISLNGYIDTTSKSTSLPLFSTHRCGLAKSLKSKSIKRIKPSSIKRTKGCKKTIRLVKIGKFNMILRSSTLKKGYLNKSVRRSERLFNKVIN